jgi:6-pyruvoyltetrahydropterin/6-carboxytetrahydropterin synthase
MSNFQSTKVIDLGSCAFRQPFAESHCRWIHGYRLQSKIWYGCNELDENNWVVDFGGLKGLRKKFEKQFDHTMCIAANDPALPYFKDLHAEDICDLRVMENGTGIERIAEWCFTIADNHINSMTRGRCWVDRVEVWEHEKNSAAYNRPSDLEGVSRMEGFPGGTEAVEGEPEIRLDAGEPLAPQKDLKSENNKTGQSKVTNKWIDPKSTNPWGV